MGRRTWPRCVSCGPATPPGSRARRTTCIGSSAPALTARGSSCSSGTDPRDATRATYDPTVAGRLLDALAAHDMACIASLYAPNAVLDAHVPHWRYQLQGGDAITAAIDESYPSPARFTAARTFGTGAWQVLEVEAWFSQGGEERLPQPAQPA